jgi:hypothetical protein
MEIDQHAFSLVKNKKGADVFFFLFEKRKGGDGSPILLAFTSKIDEKKAKEALEKDKNNIEPDTSKQKARGKMRWVSKTLTVTPLKPAPGTIKLTDMFTRAAKKASPKPEEIIVNPEEDGEKQPEQGPGQLGVSPIELEQKVREFLKSVDEQLPGKAQGDRVPFVQNAKIELAKLGDPASDVIKKGQERLDKILDLLQKQKGQGTGAQLSDAKAREEATEFKNWLEAQLQTVLQKVKVTPDKATREILNIKKKMDDGEKKFKDKPELKKYLTEPDFLLQDKIGKLRIAIQERLKLLRRKLLTDPEVAKEMKERAGKLTQAITSETRTAPPPGPSFNPDVKQTDRNGITVSARVGVPGDVVPPPPKGEELRLPNLTKEEREAESNFIKAFDAKGPPPGHEKLSDDFIKLLQKNAKPNEPLTFGTDDVKVLDGNWSSPDLDKPENREERSKNRATLNCALHQVANAVAKNAFVKFLSGLPKGSEVMVTCGGCGAGKGYAIKNNPKVKQIKSRCKAVWDSAGDQNGTESPWIQKLIEQHELKVHYVYVHSDPVTRWADPGLGVVSRAKDPGDGRMVDAKVFADSYALGAKNHQAFVEQKRGKVPNTEFIFIDTTVDPAQEVPDIPPAGLELDPDQLTSFAVCALMEDDQIPDHVKRGGSVGSRIWK